MDEDTYIIEKVVTCRTRVVPDETGVGREKVREYLVAWEGYGEEESSWHTEDELYDLGAENFDLIGLFSKARKAAKQAMTKQKKKAKVYVENQFDAAYQKSETAVDHHLGSRLAREQRLEDERQAHQAAVQERCKQYLEVERERILALTTKLIADPVYPGGRTPAPVLPVFVERLRTRIRPLRTLAMRSLCANIELYDGYANLPMEWKRDIYLYLAKRGEMTKDILLNLLHESQSILDLRPLRGNLFQNIFARSTQHDSQMFPKMAARSPHLTNLTIDIQHNNPTTYVELKNFTRLSRLHISTVLDVMKMHLFLPDSLKTLSCGLLPHRYRVCGLLRHMTLSTLSIIKHGLPNLTSLDLSPTSSIPYDVVTQLLQRPLLVKLRVSCVRRFEYDEVLGFISELSIPTSPPNRTFQLLDLQCPHLPSDFYDWLLPQPELEYLRLYALAPSISLKLEQSPKLKELFMVDCNTSLPKFVTSRLTRTTIRKWVTSDSAPFQPGTLQWQTFPPSIDTLSLIQFLYNCDGSHAHVASSCPSLDINVIEAILSAPNKFSRIELCNGPNIPIEEILLLLKTDLPLTELWLDNVGDRSLQTASEFYRSKSWANFEEGEVRLPLGSTHLSFHELPFDSIRLRCYPLVTTLSLRSMFWITQDICKKLVSPSTFPLVKYLDLTGLNLYNDKEDDGSFWTYVTNSFRLHTLLVGNFGGSRLYVRSKQVRPYINFESVYNGGSIRVLEISSAVKFSWLDYEQVFASFPNLHTFSLFGDSTTYGDTNEFPRLREALRVPNVGRSLRVLALLGVHFEVRMWHKFMAQSNIRDYYTQKSTHYIGKNGHEYCTRPHGNRFSYVRGLYKCGGKYSFA